MAALVAAGVNEHTVARLAGRKLQGERNQVPWLDDADDDQLYFSVVSLGEILKGVTVLPESKRRSRLQQRSMKHCGRFKAASSR